ncbi:MAG: phosphoribosylformylglycinamidine synthase subunit PurL [Candidatus Omnitrophota bacterium]
MIWRVEIKDKKGIFDAIGDGTQKDILDLGIRSVKKVSFVQVYLIEGNCSESNAKTICEELLVDRIIQDYSLQDSAKTTTLRNSKDLKVIEIAHNVGVMDPVEASTLKGIADLGIAGIASVRTAKKYILTGKVSSKESDVIVNKILCNKLIQHVVKDQHFKGGSPPKAAILGQSFKLIVVDILGADDKKLLALSQQGQLFLNLNEMKTIQDYFKNLGRNPTDCELETIAQTWSEHCGHKTFRGNIEYTCQEDGKTQKTLIQSLLKTTIVKATKEINKSWCVSVFHDNAGVIKFDDEDCVCFKVETHNHPSALEPFGGANTGVGGVIRDILGTGLGAKPICNTDVFCFAPPDLPFNRLPEGTLHPKRIMKGVVSGVRDYGNKMGIPTVNGAILFDEHFVGNPLVYCGTVGIMPNDKVKKQTLVGDLVVVAGGRTGRDGIHGATFSSGELTHESEVVSSGAVQIGNPIEEKKVLDALLKARDKNLYSAITDCGAGGLSSAGGEMGKDLGCRIDLEKVPLKYEGLSYTEIWISESQERMVLSVPKENIEELLKTFEDENAQATVIGEFTDTKRLELFYNSCQVCSLDMEFLHDGLPNITKKAHWAKPKIKEPDFKCPKSLTDKLVEVISHYNVCSKEWVIRQYDHEVQGMSIIKPLVGVCDDGPSDASVLRPKLHSQKGIAVSNGINVRFGAIDPFWMAASCIDEAVRQIISVGGSLEKIAILDNFCWGNPDKPDRLGGLVRAAQGCYFASVGYKVPFISGKDSLYNEYTDKGKPLAIPGTILISAIGIVEDVSRTVTMDFKDSGNLIYVLGETYDELGGSIYLDTFDSLGSSVPKVDTQKGTKVFEALSRAIQKGLVRSSHDCSEGGLGVAISEMAFAGGLGASIFLKDVPFKARDQRLKTKGNMRNDFILFSESNSRFVVEVAKNDQKDFEKCLKEIPFGLIGCTDNKKVLTVYGLNNDICVKVDVDFLKQSWQKKLKW